MGKLFQEKNIINNCFLMPALLLAVMMSAFLLLLPDEVFAADTDPAKEDHVTYAKDNFENVTEISLPFVDAKDVVYEWTFPYSDEFFQIPTSEFSRTMAQGSLGIAVSTFRCRHSVLEPQYETYLKQAGFTDFYPFGYDKPTTAHSLSGIIASKKIGDCTVIAAAACGEGYKNEWGGNLRVGTGDVHEGFQEAAGIMEKHLTDYIKRNNIDGEKKLWLAGFSRASAVANITAADAIESGEYEDVYCYGFGVPRTTKNPVAYPGIYNICGQYDPVPQTPLQSWGFERYGTDLFTPSEEADADYSELATSASEVYRKLSGNPFRNNPELNYQYRLILSYMGELFESSEEYADKYQDILISNWKTPDFEDLAGTLITSVRKLKNLSPSERADTLVFIDYMTMVAAQHTRANERQIKDGSWNPDEPALANMVLEHRPATYLSWLFCDRDNGELFRSGAGTRRITFEGDFATKIYQNGTLIQYIDILGNLTYMNDRKSASQDGLLPEYFMMRDGKNTVMNIPRDTACRIEIVLRDDAPLVYYDNYFGTDNLKGSSGDINVCIPTKGTFELHIEPGRPLPDLKAVNGNVRNFSSEEYHFSAVTLMKDEVRAASSEYMSKDKIIAVVLFVFNCMGLLILICMIMFVIHLRKRRRGHPPYSDWYVIMPHLIAIAVFTWLTMFIRYYMIAISQAWCECAAVTLFIIFLLALRGHIRYQNMWNAATTALLLVIALMMQLFGDKLSQNYFSLVTVIIFCGVIAGLTILAARTFFRRQQTIPSIYPKRN